MAKRTRKDYAPHISPEEALRCEIEGCMEAGAYKAPRSRDILHEYRFLCLEHVREHNQKWNYFAGMEADEIETFQKESVTGHRPTWERMPNDQRMEDKVYAAVNNFLNMGGRKKTKPIPRLSGKMNKAITLFEIEFPYTQEQLKVKYKQLVKRYHPDHHQGDKLAEEKFKAITNAYKVLNAYLHEE